MDHFRTNIAIIPKPSTFEAAFALTVAAFMFIPFTVGIFLQNGWPLLSMPIGIFIFVIVSLSNKGKFVPRYWVQKESFIEFTLHGVRIIRHSGHLDFPWSVLENTQLYVERYDGESYHSGDQTYHYNGTENRITFKVGSLNYDFNFYLKNAEQKKALQLLLRNRELTAPKAQDGAYDADFDCYKKEVPKQELPKNQKRR